MTLAEGSANSVEIEGDSGNFNARKLGLGARFGGRIGMDHWTMTPSIGVEYQDVQRESFTDSAGVTVAGGSEGLGRVTFGPEIERAFAIIREDGVMTVHPFARVTGVWDFQSQDDAEATAKLFGQNEVYARVGGGLRMFWPGDMALGVSTDYAPAADADQLSLAAELSLPMSFRGRDYGMLNVNASSAPSGQGYAGMRYSLPMK